MYFHGLSFFSSDLHIVPRIFAYLGMLKAGRAIYLSFMVLGINAPIEYTIGIFLLLIVSSIAVLYGYLLILNSYRLGFYIVLGISLLFGAISYFSTGLSLETIVHFVGPLVLFGVLQIDSTWQYME